MSVPVNPGWPQDYTGEEEGGGSASRELGVVGGVSLIVMLPWKPVTKAAREAQNDALPTGFSLLGCFSGTR